MPSSTTTPMATSTPNDKATTNKKKKGLSLSSFKSPFKFLGKTYCKGCRKRCSGEVLRVNEFYFHNGCFKCDGCQTSLSSGGYFVKEKEFFCGSCYQGSFGTKCFKCDDYVEGEVVTALGKTYHQKCFKCAKCNKPFPTGDRVTFTGEKCFCQKCVISVEESSAMNELITPSNGTVPTSSAGAVLTDICAGCSRQLKDGQALVALDKQYHVWCFKCKACGCLLHREYMGKDGFPYCEKDYQKHFGVRCTYCSRFISGKVLQAGNNNHFHPTCARCTKCGEPFGDGEEMFLQGAAIWHPRCGPGPDESGIVVSGLTDMSSKDYDDRVSNISVGAYGSRASSPGLRRGGPEYDSGRFSRATTANGGGSGWKAGGIYNSSSTYSLRRPIEPGDLNMGSSSHLNHFHVPAGRIRKPSNRYGARTSMDSIPLGSLRPLSAPPKPGYTQRATIRNNGAFSPDYTSCSEYDPNRSDMVSQASYRTTDFSELRPSYGYGRSGYNTPVVITNHKIYPYHLIMTTNFKMPPEVDRCNLEKHLNEADFQMVFDMKKDRFYELPIWRRNDMKRRARLF